MDLRKELQTLFEELGYHDAFPTSLYINPSTCHIWRQLLDNVKSKHYVDDVRKNLILNRMSKVKLDPLDAPLKEIEAYHKLETKKRKMEKIQSRICNKEMDQTETANEQLYLKIDALKRKKEEKQLQIHLLKQKIHKLQKEDSDIEKLMEEQLIEDVSEESNMPENVIVHLISKLISDIDQLKNKRYSEIVQTHNKNRRGQFFNSTKTSQTLFNQTDDSRSYFGRNLFPSPITKNIILEEFSVLSSINEETIRLDESSGLLPDSCFEFPPDEKFFTSDLTIGNDSDLKSGLLDKDEIETIYSSKSIMTSVKRICQKNSKSSLYSYIYNMKKSFETIKDDLLTTMENSSFSENDRKEMYFTFITTNLKILKVKKEIENLSKIKREKMDKLKRCGLDNKYKNLTSCGEVQDYTISGDKDIRLKNINSTIDGFKTKLLQTINKIQEELRMSRKIFECVELCKNETFVTVEKLVDFFDEPLWAANLSNQIYTDELDKFKFYPFHYNRRSVFMPETIYYRDLMSIASDESIMSMLEHPYKPLEHTVFKMLKNKKTLDFLEMLEFFQMDVDFKNISSEDVILGSIGEEVHSVKNTCHLFESQIRSQQSFDIARSEQVLKECMELWLKMPFRKYISKNRLLAGKTYREYEGDCNYLLLR